MYSEQIKTQFEIGIENMENEIPNFQLEFSFLF